MAFNRILKVFKTFYGKKLINMLQTLLKSSKMSKFNSQSFFWAEYVNHFASKSDAVSSYVVHMDFTKTYKKKYCCIIKETEKY